MSNRTILILYEIFLVWIAVVVAVDFSAAGEFDGWTVMNLILGVWLVSNVTKLRNAQRIQKIET